MFKNVNKHIEVLKYAFPYTIPILCAFLFLGFSYGLYIVSLGFSFVYPMIMSIVIFGGSLEFVAGTLLLSAFAPLQTFLLAFAIQARHIFYGLALINKFRTLKKWKPYVIYSLCDESYSIIESVEIDEKIDKNKFYICVVTLNHLYWFLGATFGALIGKIFNIYIEGIDFVMTSMFICIFISQCQKKGKLIFGVVGVVFSIICILLFGKNSFIIPTMIMIVIFVYIYKMIKLGGVGKRI